MKEDGRKDHSFIDSLSGLDRCAMIDIKITSKALPGIIDRSKDLTMKAQCMAEVLEAAAVSKSSIDKKQLATFTKTMKEYLDSALISLESAERAAARLADPFNWKKKQ